MIPKLHTENRTVIKKSQKLGNASISPCVCVFVCTCVCCVHVRVRERETLSRGCPYYSVLAQRQALGGPYSFPRIPGYQ